MPDGLAGLLTLHPERSDEFVGDERSELLADPRLFGGALLAMAVRAASSTVAEDRTPHSMHHVFASPARPGTPVRLRVTRAYDGRTFTVRRVDLWQGGVPRGTATLSFAAAEPGLDVPLPMRADAPPPHSASARRPVFAGLAFAVPFELREIDLRHIDLDGGGTPGPDRGAAGPHRTTRLLWARLTEPLPSAGLPCALAYLSDFGATIAARAAVGADPRTPGQFATLNHTLWWHRGFTAGEWLLVDFRPISAAGSRGLVAVSVHTQAGVHVATVVQEALMRLDRSG
jgi:acyl-CoA thioesterase II